MFQRSKMIEKIKYKHRERETYRGAHPIWKGDIDLNKVDTIHTLITLIRLYWDVKPFFLKKRFHNVERFIDIYDDTKHTPVIG